MVKDKIISKYNYSNNVNLNSSQKSFKRIPFFGGANKVDFFESINFGDLKNILNDCNYFSEEIVKQKFGLSISFLKNLVCNKLKQLEPIEKEKNAEYILRHKIGKSNVIKKITKMPTDIIFTEDNGLYYAYIDYIKVGQIGLSPVHQNGMPIKGYVAGLYPVYQGDSLYAYGMESFDNSIYTGVGTKLHQLAVEKSIKQRFEGKVTLKTFNPGAKLFHYKSGFRKVGDDSEEFSKQMEKVIKREKSLLDIDNEAINMYLPDEQIQKIIENQIAKMPILNL